MARALAGALDYNPVEGTYLGDHTRDGRLGDPSSAAAEQRAAELRVLLAELDAVPTDGADEAVERGGLRTVTAAELLELHELREAEWNPMVHNPGGGLHALLSRDFAPLPVRLASAGHGSRQCRPTSRRPAARLEEMSAVHVETAIGQLDGTIRLVGTRCRPRPERAGGSAPGLVDAASAASAALHEHRQWLADRLEDVARDPRIGPDLFRAKLALTLDTGYDPQALLARAEAELTASTEQIVELAGRISGHGAAGRRDRARRARPARRRAPTDATILERCTAALSRPPHSSASVSWSPSTTIRSTSS